MLLLSLLLLNFLRLCSGRLSIRPGDYIPQHSPVFPSPADPDGSWEAQTFVRYPEVSIVAISGFPSDPQNQVTGLGRPIEASSYFSIDQDCYDIHKEFDNSDFKNRGAFYEQAWKDATHIADKGRQWPQYGSDAADYYFGFEIDKEEFSKNIIANIKRAAEWGTPEWGFDPYINLSCNDLYNACENKIGSDPRAIMCYVNNTRSRWWNKSTVRCCDPFFRTFTVDQQFEYNRNKGEDQDLRYLQTSGTALLHEMFHTIDITESRPRVLDQEFPGTLRTRIYGPKDVNKAATNRDLAPRLTAFNADSYAQFASAMFWKDIFGKLPIVKRPGSIVEDSPDFSEEYISDSDTNYVSLQLPDPTPVCAGTPTDKPSVAQPYAQAKIVEFCQQLVEYNITVGSRPGNYEYNPVGYAGGETDPQKTNQMWLSVTKDPICNKNTSYLVEEMECRRFMGIILNGCNTDSNEEKWGGRVYGRCSIWNITTRASGTDEPPDGFPHPSKLKKSNVINGTQLYI